MKKGRTVLEAKRVGVHSCQQDAPLLSVCQQMMASDVNALIVVDAQGFLRGVISQTDLLRAHLDDDDWAERAVRDCMSRDVVTVSPSATLQHVAELLLENQIRRVVAVREEGSELRPVAVISSRDLVYHMMKDD